MKCARLMSALPLLVLLGPVAAEAQVSDATISLHPVVSLPLGPGEVGLPYYDMGVGGSLRAEIVPSFAQWLFGRVSVDYEYLPLHGTIQGLSFISGGGDIGAVFSPIPQLSLMAGGGGGMYIAIAQGGTVRNPYVEGGAEARFLITSALAVSAGARYRLFFLPTEILYHGISIDLGVSYNLAGSIKGTNVRVEPKIDPVFPLFYSYYDSHPLGTALVANNESIPIEKVKITFYAKQYMDAPRVCGSYDAIEPGKTREVPIYALFNDAIFKVTEGTMAAGELDVEYYYLGSLAKKAVPVTVQVNNRNAMTWDDDRKVAAFVTAKDPLVLSLAKEIASFARTDSQVVSTEFRTALGIFQALGIYGVGYTVDPTTPFSSASTSDTIVDFLQFPNQTLAYRAGDCDDLTALYCALLESVGVSSAFITIPGHIFAAFDSGLSPENAAKVLPNFNEVIAQNGRIWVPVEITMIKNGFLRAWSSGAAEWRDAVAKNAAAFYPVGKAWELYKPVGFADGPAAAAFPAHDALLSAFRAEIGAFARTAISGRVADLKKQIQGGQNVEKAANSLGVLYAKYGLMEDARAQFLLAVQQTKYVPALVNLGNLEFLSGDMEKARSYYEQALAAAPADSGALVGYARSLQYGGDTEGFQNAVARLAAIYPSVAVQYFPGGVTAQRASDLETREIKEWHE
jgi:tetratricopeptide (TPR) repeat protein